MSLARHLFVLDHPLRRNLASVGSVPGLLLLLAGMAPAVTVAADGNAAYNQHCLVCHGADLSGVPNLGVALTGSSFVADKSVAELAEFLKIGRMPGDPGTISNGAMPGFAWVSEEELRAISEYLKAQ